MDEILRALGDIVVKALPTFFLVVLLHFFLKYAFFKPLERVLEERRARTEGAREAAAQSLSQAAARAAEYEAALQSARSVLYKEQEERRAAWRSEQSAAVAEARQRSQAAVNAAGETIRQEAAQAREQLPVQAQAIADQIARRILERTPA